MAIGQQLYFDTFKDMTVSIQNLQHDFKAWILRVGPVALGGLMDSSGEWTTILLRDLLAAAAKENGHFWQAPPGAIYLVLAVMPSRSIEEQVRQNIAASSLDGYIYRVNGKFSSHGW